jgi:phenylacetate-CoA ligase
MSGYFKEADPGRIAAEYPLGDALLSGPGRLSRDELRELQEARFQKVIARAWEVPFYQRRWGAVGLEPGDISGLADIEKIPAYSKSDLMASVAEHPPLGDFAGLDGKPGHRQRVLHTTSGTTGDPQPLLFGAWDREVQNALLARAYLLQGMRHTDVVHSVYGFGMVNGGHYVREALLHYTETMVLTAGTGAETRSTQQVDLMRRFGVTAIVGFCDYIAKLAEVAKDEGLESGRDIPVRMIAGHLGEWPRAGLEAAWGGAKVYDWYGVGDTGIIAAEGPNRDGLHIWEDAHYVEILATESGATLPVGDTGNLCVTVLFKDTIYPIIRFNTMDLSSRLPAGAASPEDPLPAFGRIAGFRGRSDDMVKLRGINVYPTGIAALLESFSECTGEYVCQVDRVANRDEMSVTVEWRGERDAAAQTRVAAHLRERLAVEVGVELVGPGESAAWTEIDSRQKPRRLLDRRPKT